MQEFGPTDPRHWIRKFHFAMRGIRFGMTGQSSFTIHLLVGLLVLILAGVLRCVAWQWCVLLLCIGLVFSAELANSAVEELVRGLCHEHNEHVGRALDIASGAVLVASLFSATIGIIVLGWQLVVYLQHFQSAL